MTRFMIDPLSIILPRGREHPEQYWQRLMAEHFREVLYRELRIRPDQWVWRHPVGPCEATAAPEVMAECYQR